MGLVAGQLAAGYEPRAGRCPPNKSKDMLTRKTEPCMTRRRCRPAGPDEGLVKVTSGSAGDQSRFGHVRRENLVEDDSRGTARRRGVTLAASERRIPARMKALRMGRRNVAQSGNRL